MSESDSDLFIEEEVGESKINYFWFIAFEWSLIEQNPFQIFVREYFGDADIPDSWFNGLLSEKNRQEKLQLNAVAGENPYSIFAKVEKGE